MFAAGAAGAGVRGSAMVSSPLDTTSSRGGAAQGSASVTARAGSAAGGADGVLMTTTSAIAAATPSAPSMPSAHTRRRGRSWRDGVARGRGVSMRVADPGATSSLAIGCVGSSDDAGG